MFCSKNYSNRRLLPVLKGFTFNYASLKFLRKFVFEKFGGGGKTEKSQSAHTGISIILTLEKFLR